jgi:hypothetical protein
VRLELLMRGGVCGGIMLSRSAREGDDDSRARLADEDRRLVVLLLLLLALESLLLLSGVFRVVLFRFSMRDMSVF